MTVRIETDGKIATITLDRPERMNAINPEMSRQLDEFWSEFDQDDNLHVAIITGAGRAFCAGRDLVRPDAHKDEIDRAATSAARREADPSNAAGLSSWGPDKTWKPVIAAINGWCLAGGFALALSCDLRIMSDTARIGSMAPKRGLLPGRRTGPAARPLRPLRQSARAAPPSQPPRRPGSAPHRTCQRRHHARRSAAHRPRVGRGDRLQRPPRRPSIEARRLRGCPPPDRLRRGHDIGIAALL